MPTVTLKAHYDGRHIILDEPFELPVHTPLAVTVFTSCEKGEIERAEWTQLAAENLAQTYCGQEPEYTLADLKD